MNDASDLLIRIHIATCDQLAALKTEAESYIAGTPSLIPYFISHWGRELNRRSNHLCGSPLYLSYDGGLRPTDPNEYLDFTDYYLLLEDGSYLLLEDNSRIILE